VWQYDVHAGRAGVDDLLIEARFAPGSSDELRIDEHAARFVSDVAYMSGEHWPAAVHHGPTWVAPCRASGCRVRYRFGLRSAAATIDRGDIAIGSGDVVVAPPSTWLLRPAEGDRSRRFRFKVTTVAPTRFAAGTRRSPDGAPDTFEAATAALEESSFAVFGSFHQEAIQSGEARVEVAMAPHALALTDDEIVGWVRRAVDGIAAYFGRFSADHTLVIVQAGDEARTEGETLGDSGPAVLVRVGREVTAASVRDDWVVTHELLHVSLPSLSPRHAWLSEGIPTYVEPIVRARAGQLTAEKFWADLVEGLPQGLPEAGDEGLERTHTWGRTYWGGALFCFVADVTIRERSANTLSLDDSLRAVIATRADVEAHWDIDRWLEEGDRATATRVLHDLYRRFALAPGTVDLAGLWARLGVRLEAGRVRFDDGAPLAAVRRAITQHR
jgi:predicted metalloprotease with PDZ domain